jgi:hypothetical protein
MSVLADTNAGFYGTINTTEWAQMAGIGVRFAVLGTDDLKVTQGAGDRGLTVRAGEAWGDGVLSAFNTNTALNATAVSSGSRWDTVVIRRTWQPTLTPTGTAQLLILPGSSVKAVAPLGASATQRKNDPGVTQSDHPIALARFAANSTVVQEIVDLRVWTGSGGGLVAVDETVLTFLNDAGTQVRIGPHTWASTPGTNGLSWTTTEDPQRVTMYGTGAGLSGSLSGANGFLIQAGTTTQRSNPYGSSSPGAARVTFPRSFPNGVLTVVTTNGHDAATGFVEYSLTPSGYGYYRDSFVYMCRDHSGGARVDLQHRINWIAIGW